MQRCLQLAGRAEGHVRPNPMVGCVIEANGEIIAEGFHRQYGGPHAEIEALRALPSPVLPPEATVYVSLEPCAHFGKTPPCADALLSAGAKRVVVACRDPFDQVNGRGIERLREAGVDVIEGVLEKEARDLNKRFFTFHQKKRPYVLLKWAETADGFMDAERTPDEKGVRWISAPEMRKLVHLWRSREAGLLIGANTAINDDPELTVREVAGQQPLRILIDPDLRVARDARMFGEDGHYLVFHRCEGPESDKHIRIEEKDLLPSVLQRLHSMNVQSLMAEGGAQTLQQFIEAGLWDEIRVIRSRTVTYGKGLRAPSTGCRAIRSEAFGSDTIFTYRQ
jgi:diaminohydroxyphosphoribosylaminopyrimidine deaminase / 5-amino-6-(5-phosphoribosylamino)uracil reductase